MKKQWNFILALVFFLAALLFAWQQGILFPSHASYPASILPKPHSNVSRWPNPCHPGIQKFRAWNGTETR